LTIRRSKLEPTGVTTDLLHRVGFPFGNLGPPTMLFLVAGLVLVCLPSLLGRSVSDLADRFVRIALVVVIVLSAIISVGSLLAVRNSLHEYTARGTNPPMYARIGFATFLLGTLGGAAAAIFGSLAAMSVRRRREADAED
jgi:hypothetical protein